MSVSTIITHPATKTPPAGIKITLTCSNLSGVFRPLDLQIVGREREGGGVWGNGWVMDLFIIDMKSRLFGINHVFTVDLVKLFT